jgi:hypothetical protein
MAVEMTAQLLASIKEYQGLLLQSREELLSVWLWIPSKNYQV